MNELEIYLKDKNLSDEELLIVNELVQFFNNKEASIDNLSDIEEKINIVKYKLNLAFINLLYNKINLLKKEQELNMTFTFLFGEFKNYNEFYKKIGLRVEEIRKVIINSYGFYLQDNEIYAKILEKLDSLEKQEQEIRSKKFKLYDEFLWVYLNSRNYTNNIKQITGVSPSEFLKILDKENLRDYYPENIDKIIEDKTKQLNNLKISRVSDALPVREVELVQIVKPEVLKVSSSDYKRLEVVVEFLKNNGNIYKMNNNYNRVFTMLDLDRLKDILNDDTYRKVSSYLMIEENLQELFVREREELIRSMIIKYYTVNGNLVKLIESGEQEEVVFRLLSDELVIKIIGLREYNKVLTSLKEYKEKKDVIKVIRKIKTPEVIYN